MSKEKVNLAYLKFVYDLNSKKIVRIDVSNEETTTIHQSEAIKRFDGNFLSIVYNFLIKLLDKGS